MIGVKGIGISGIFQDSLPHDFVARVSGRTIDMLYLLLMFVCSIMLTYIYAYTQKPVINNYE